MILPTPSAPIETTRLPEATIPSSDRCPVTQIAIHALRVLSLSLFVAGVGCLAAGLQVPAIALFVSSIALLLLSILLPKPREREEVQPLGQAEPIQEPVSVKWYVGGAAISIERGDIFKAGVPCIVNAANEQCLGGGGIDGAIHRAAGSGLLDLCRKLPIVQPPNVRCKTGDAVITGSGKLADQGIDFIIHAVGPRNSDPKKEELLEAAYQNILARAEENGIRSLAIPAISTGIFGFPFRLATEIALRTIETYLHEHPEKFDEVKLVFLDHASEQAPERPTNWALAVEIARSSLTSQNLGVLGHRS
ncbi:MAG TPA: macro domain-containing protein [Chlamydiales bacterium]|nr:macro domain-containing protein [Chlamydiales bacterium]